MNDYKALLEKFITNVVQQNASDLHLSEGRSPVIRVNGTLVVLVREPVLTRADVEGMASVLLTKQAHEQFTTTKEVDFSYSNKDARFRGNGFVRQDKIS